MVLQQSLEKIFEKLSISNYSILHDNPDPEFGNIETNPTKIPSLDSLKILQKEKCINCYG